MAFISLNMSNTFLESVDSISEAAKLDVNSLDTVKLSNYFRFLRGKCTDNSFQNEAGEHPYLVTDSLLFLENLALSYSELTEEHISCLRIVIQFLGNLTVRHDRNQEKLWKNFNLFRYSFSIGDLKARGYAAGVVNNIIRDKIDRSMDIASDKSLMKIVLNDAMNDAEFSLFLIETILKQGGFEVLYICISGEQRLFLLELLASEENLVGETEVLYLSKLFKCQSDCILKTVSDHVESLQPLEVVTLATLLGRVTSNVPLQKVLQKDRSLLINCCYLLKAMMSAGKEYDNYFTPVPKLLKNSESLEAHPAFGFKVELVRIIGNLCCGSKTAQDLVRELECIPLILECCNIDARNPFITQWAILAVKNLCESNNENKLYISSMTVKEFIQTPVLEELGITLHSDGTNKISIVPICEKK